MGWNACESGFISSRCRIQLLWGVSFMFRVHKALQGKSLIMQCSLKADKSSLTDKTLLGNSYPSPANASHWLFQVPSQKWGFHFTPPGRLKLKISVVACDFTTGETTLSSFLLLHEHLDAIPAHHQPDLQACLWIHQHIIKHRSKEIHDWGLLWLRR